MTRPPLFITCQNPRCGRIKAVATPYEQRRRKYCSRQCVGAVHGGVQHLSHEALVAAAEKSKASRRRQAMARLKDLTPIQIYRMAFSTGWKSGVRSARRRFADHDRTEMTDVC